MFEQFGFFQEFIINTWGTFTDFVDHINENDSEILFEGETTIQRSTNIDGVRYIDSYLFFKLNGKLYASLFKEDHENNGSIYFDGISEFSDILFKSEDYLELIRRSSKNRFKDLGIGIPIDIKCYTYQDEQRIIMSQQGKIDMIYSQKMFIDEDNNFQFKTETTVSLKKLVDWHKFNAATMARLQKIESKKPVETPKASKLED